MKRLAIFCSLVVCVITSTQSFAQEYFYPNGVFVGVDVKASIMHREKKIGYGLWAPTVEITGTNINDVTVSPSFLVGYKVNSNDSFSVRTDWSRYSVNRSAANDGSLGIGFGVLTIDGLNNFGDATTPATASMKWRSNAVNTELEYQRRLWSDQLGAILGLLGFGHRFEGQKFQGEGGTTNGLVDSTKERLNENLFGPYGGLKVSFKPSEGSNLSFSVKSNFGYYFKSSSLRAREDFDPNGVTGFPPGSFRVNDNSSTGTAFATVGLNTGYAIMKNINVALDYRFGWINRAAHIENPKLDTNTGAALNPARIGSSAILDHKVGFDLIFNY